MSTTGFGAACIIQLFKLLGAVALILHVMYNVETEFPLFWLLTNNKPTMAFLLGSS